MTLEAEVIDIGPEKHGDPYFMNMLGAPRPDDIVVVLSEQEGTTTHRVVRVTWIAVEAKSKCADLLLKCVRDSNERESDDRPSVTDFIH